MASSSTSTIRKNFSYHVFLSFRGEDTRTTFVDHLYASLKQKGIHTFRDDHELKKGKTTDQIFKAIEESRFFIIVFSRNYASSSWHLKELAKIMDCQDGKEQIAYPLFYDVRPSDIRRQSGPVKKAIAKHKSNKQIKTWKNSLEDAGNLVGWDLKKIVDGHEDEAIDQIVKEISVKLRSIRLSNVEIFVGMESRMQDLESSLGIGFNDKSRMIGIKGMRGSGKTTLARAIFDRFSSHFEGSIFVENVSEVSKKMGLRKLQEQILSGVLNKGKMRVESVRDGRRVMRMMLSYKKVLLVLDDVDDIEQLDALAGDWFKDGSRIIITTTDDKVLLAEGVNANLIHDVSFLSDEEAMSLFSMYAFKSYIPDEGYEELSSQVVSYAAGLPLTIRVLASHLRGERELVWRDALKRLETIPSRETLQVLEISYNSLECDFKLMLLDVACCSLREISKDYVIRMLESCGFRATYGLRVLEQKSFITILDNKLKMHDSIQELGRDIVRREHPREPNKHSRLWIKEEIEELLCDDEVAEAAATFISVRWLNLSPEIIMKGLGKLKRLRLLHISGRDDDRLPDNWMFYEDNFPNSLRFLHWERYPGRSLPQTFRANNLVGLELPRSRITKLWESEEREVLKKLFFTKLWKSQETKVLENLRFLNLSDSKLRTLDLRMTPNLERLDLEGCHDLTEIYAPAGCLEKLIYINLIGCSQLNSSSFVQQSELLEALYLPNLQVTVKSLNEFTRDSCDNLPKLSFTCFYGEEQASSRRSSQKSVSLDLQPGTKLESVSKSFFGLLHLRHLTFTGCIPELPNDLDRLANLEELKLVGTHIKCLPDSIFVLKHLKSLKLYSEFLEELPTDLGRLVCLEKLTLSSERITNLPDSLCMMKHLKSLELKGCRLLRKLPRDLGQLECLEKLNLRECKSLKSIPNDICNMRSLKELNVKDTGISHLPDSISSLGGLRIVGSEAVLQSCVSATEIIHTSETDTFCYIRSTNSR